MGTAVVMTLLGGCSPQPLRMVTHDLPGLSGMEALLRATLIADEDGCVIAKTAGDHATLVWPKGYTVRGNPGSFEILDSDMNVVAPSGVPLAIGGGAAGRFNDAWTGRECLTGRLWMVGRVGVL